MTDAAGAIRTSGIKVRVAGATETTSGRIVDAMYSVGKSISREAQTASWCAVGNDRTN
jgi:hypothetical protein